MKKSASCIVINPGVVLYVISQSTLVLARVHIIHTSIRSYNNIIFGRFYSLLFLVVGPGKKPSWNLYFQSLSKPSNLHILFVQPVFKLEF